MIQHVNFRHVSYPFSHAGDASQELLPPVAAIHAAGGQRHATRCPKKKNNNPHTCNFWVAKGRQGVIYPGYTAISVNFLWYG